MSMLGLFVSSCIMEGHLGLGQWRLPPFPLRLSPIPLSPPKEGDAGQTSALTLPPAVLGYGAPARFPDPLA